MRGQYYLTKHEVAMWKPIFEEKIQQLINEEIDEWDLTHEELSPANVNDLLCNHMGYSDNGFDDNGWQQDTWYNFIDFNTNIQLTLYYCGFDFEMKLHLRDCEE